MRPLSDSLRTGLASAATRYSLTLTNSPAEAYLADRWGSARASAAAKRFGLGFVQDPIPGHERFAGRLSIPNRCATGHVVGMKFRAVDDTEPKYDAISGLPGRLFNLAVLPSAGPFVVLTEGEMDAIVLSMMGFPAIGIPGASAWKSHHSRIFDGFERVVLVRDNDKAGGDLAKRLTETDLPVDVVYPPGGVKDADEAVRAGFGPELAAAIRGDKP